LGVISLPWQWITLEGLCKILSQAPSLYEVPLEFLQGRVQIILGLEQALYGMAVDDEKDVIVEVLPFIP
jgi:FKBP-type peptidyl-prolyl cis-trans isomerase 2